MVEVVVRTDVFEKFAGDFRHGVEVGGGLGCALCVALLGRATIGFVGFPVQFLAVAAAVPLVLAFGAAFERFVR